MKQTESNINEEYILCFKDFQAVENSRQPCVFIKIKNFTSDTMEDIAKSLSGIRSGTSLLNKIGYTNGKWGLVAIHPANHIQIIEYKGIQNNEENI